MLRITDLGETGPAQMPALDIEGAIQALGGSEAALREVVWVFLQYADESLAAMRRVAGSPAEVQALVHELGSSLGAVGARDACSQARELERRLRNGDTAAVSALVGLEACVEETVRLLAQWLAGPRMQVL